MALAIDVRLDADLGAVPAAARILEEAGVSGLFTYEGPSDPFLPLAVAATSTTAPALYTNLAIALPRSPVHLAYLAHDLQRASGGRFLLGMGTQVKKHVQQRFGTTWESPVEQLREWVLAVRAIQDSWRDGAPLHFEGRWTSHTYMPPLFVPPPLPSGPAPLLVGAMGPKMVAMATEVADGLLVHPFCTDRSLAEHTFPLVDAGLQGRTDFSVVGQGIVGVASDDRELDKARSGVRTLIAFYASTPAYRVVLDVHGWGELQTELRDLTRAGRWDTLAGAVPQEVVDAVAIVGTPQEVAARLTQRYGRCSRVALSLPYEVSVDTLAALVDATGALAA